jgi:hypothetical protein
MKILTNQQHRELLEQLDDLQTKVFLLNEKNQICEEKNLELEKKLQSYQSVSMEDVDTGKIEKELEKIPDDVRETFLIYLRYYALSLARESLKCEKVTDIKFRD